jgi:hypothetical protein
VHVETLEFGLTAPVEPTALAARLNRDPDHRIRAVLVCRRTLPLLSTQTSRRYGRRSMTRHTRLYSKWTASPHSAAPNSTWTDGESTSL